MKRFVFLLLATMTGMNLSSCSQEKHIFFLTLLFKIGKTGVSHGEHSKRVLRKREFTPQLYKKDIL